MVIRIPATLVALALALALDAGTFALARFEPLALAPIVLLPLWAGAGGFVSARWRDTNAPAPGLAVGLLLVASQFGAALGPYPELLALLDPRLLLLQLIAAMSGGLSGAILARRSSQASQPNPELTPLA